MFGEAEQNYLLLYLKFILNSIFIIESLTQLTWYSRDLKMSIVSFQYETLFLLFSKEFQGY